MHSDCTRARVAIDVPMIALGSLNPPPLNAVLHLGHARTILLGSLIAEGYGLPFHIRMDGAYGQRSRVGAVLMPLCTIISRLAVTVDEVYWQPSHPPSPQQYQAHFGERAEDMAEFLAAITNSAAGSAGLFADDLIHHHPSLVIRGVEFVDDVYGMDGPSTTTVRTVQTEALVAKTLGRERHEVNVPLITMGGAKVSKSVGPSLPWELFVRYPGPWVRRFLLATAMKPEAPLSALRRGFTLERMSQMNYEWDWATWDQYIRECEDQT